MGCGQSKIGIYQRKSKNKKNGSKRSAGNGENDGETDDGEDTVNADKKESGTTDKGEEESDSVTSKFKQTTQQQTGGAVLAQSDISSSQLDFFKMLDEKIENGPDYEESDEEEQKTRMANLLEEWKASCQARQQKKMDASEQEKWSSPGHSGKLYQEDYENYPGKRVNVNVTQRFPLGYTPCPPNSNINIHLQNSYRMNSPLVDQPRMQPRIPIIGNYHPYQPPSETYLNHLNAAAPHHALAPNDPLNPLRANSSQVLLRQSSIPSQVQHYPENQRLYPESMRHFPDFTRSYQMTRPMPTVNVVYEHRLYGPEVGARASQMYPDDPRKPEPAPGGVQGMMVDVSRQYMADPQRPDAPRQPAFGNLEDQRIYHERLLEKQRQYADNPRPMEGPRPTISYGQKPPLLTQRSIPDPTRAYRDLENEECRFSRQERFSEPTQDGSSYHPYNPSHFKGGRSLSVEVHYLAGPPPPREMIPLQGAPGPPQGSPRPLVARGLQANMHRLPANSVVHFRKPQGAFT